MRYVEKNRCRNNYFSKAEMNVYREGRKTHLKRCVEKIGMSK